MSYVETVEERGDHRAVIILDEMPCQPDHDGQGAVYHVDSRGYYGYSVEELHTDYSSTSDFRGPLERALEHYGMDWELVERYFRMFHNVVGFDRIDPHRSGGTYVLLVTREDVETWGLSDDADPVAGTLETWEAWATGDVWGIRIETRVVTTIKTLSGDVVDEYEDWHELEDEYPVWGYYGRKDAEEQAREALSYHEPVGV